MRHPRKNTFSPDVRRVRFRADANSVRQHAPFRRTNSSPVANFTRQRLALGEKLRGRY